MPSGRWHALCVARSLVKNFFKVVGGPHSEYVQNFEIDGGRVARFGARRRCGRGPGRHRRVRRRRRRRQRRRLPSGDRRRPTVVAVQTPTQTEASRFLAQATFGPTEAEIDRLIGMSYAAGSTSSSPSRSAAPPLHQPGGGRPGLASASTLSSTNFFDSWWSQALGGDDQLRQRVPSRCPRSS